MKDLNNNCIVLLTVISVNKNETLQTVNKNENFTITVNKNENLQNGISVE